MRDFKTLERQTKQETKTENRKQNQETEGIKSTTIVYA